MINTLNNATFSPVSTLSDVKEPHVDEKWFSQLSTQKKVIIVAIAVLLGLGACISLGVALTTASTLGMIGALVAFGGLGLATAMVIIPICSSKVKSVAQKTNETATPNLKKNGEKAVDAVKNLSANSTAQTTNSQNLQKEPPKNNAPKMSKEEAAVKLVAAVSDGAEAIKKAWTSVSETVRESRFFKRDTEPLEPNSEDIDESEPKEEYESIGSVIVSDAQKLWGHVSNAFMSIKTTAGSISLKKNQKDPEPPK